MEAVAMRFRNVSAFQDLTLPPSLDYYEMSSAAFPSETELGPVLFSKTWGFSLTMISAMSSLLLFTYLSTTLAPMLSSTSSIRKDPPQMPYCVPVIGNLISFLLDAPKLAVSISQRFGASAVVRLNFLTKDVYIVSGAEYLNAVWRNTKGLTSTNGINLALSNMFNTSKKDIVFFEADDSGITLDPHPKSSTPPEDRVFYLMHKATIDNLAGSQLKIAAQKFQTALESQIEACSITDEWVEMDDLFRFLQPLISSSIVQAMCGVNFVRNFPDFVEDLRSFNLKMPLLLRGWPRWMIPTAWQKRDRCIAAMTEWRKLNNEGKFDGNAMFPQRWSSFSKMPAISEHGVACSDMGILWGLSSSPVPATFWLTWHMLRDRDLLKRASRELDACRTTNDASEPTGFDVTKLCSQPLLQSSFAETLRKYTAVYILRKPEHEDSQILDYKVPKGKMMVIDSTIAHLDRRNWNTGTEGEHPVETFWADRFLTYGAKPPRTTPSSLQAHHPSHPPAEIRPQGEQPTVPSTSAVGTPPPPPPPQFSLHGYSGAWIPFGGGIHQCPGRHWVKAQMLLGFATIHSAFEIDLLARADGNDDTLAVDMRKCGLGVMQPAQKVGFRIRRKEK